MNIDLLFYMYVCVTDDDNLFIHLIANHSNVVVSDITKFFYLKTKRLTGTFFVLFGEEWNWSLIKKTAGA